MSKDELNPKSFKDMNNEFQYLWNKFERNDWKVENLGKYCEALEYMVMNYLARNHALDPIISTASKSKDKKRVDQDTRPYPSPIYENYDYVDQTKSQKENGKEMGPGGGLYTGKMDKYKSVKEFIDADRKRRRQQRKAALGRLIGKNS